MSRRRYDHLRVRRNELRRIRLAKNLPWTQGPAYLTALDAILGIDANDPQQRAARQIVDARMDRAISRLCRFGNCGEKYDPLSRIVIASYGKAGCPCAA